MIYKSVRENLRELFYELGVRKNFANLSPKSGIMKVDSYYILEKIHFKNIDNLWTWKQ